MTSRPTVVPHNHSQLEAPAAAPLACEVPKCQRSECLTPLPIPDGHLVSLEDGATFWSLCPRCSCYTIVTKTSEPPGFTVESGPPARRGVRYTTSYY